MKKSMKHILLSLLALWCLLILIYISVTISASIILGANDEQIADSMLLILGIDKNRLQDLMHKPGVIGFNYNNS